MLYRASAEHARAIHIKSEGAFGQGLEAEEAEGAELDKFEELCPSGSADLFVQIGLDQECFGNAFMQIIRDQDRVIELQRLPALSMSRTKTGYIQIAAAPDGTQTQKAFADDDILHLRAPCPSGGYYSLPAWIGAETMLDLVEAATRFNQKFFDNQAIPEHAIIIKGGQLPEKEEEKIQTYFQDHFKGIDNAHRTLVLNPPEGKDVEFHKLTSDLKDGDFLKLLDAARDRIVIAHGVPPRMMGIMSAGQLGGGSEVASQLFLFENLTLAPKRRRMIDQLRPLFRELGIDHRHIRFKPHDLTPPKDNTDQVASWVQAGVISPDEARQYLDMPVNVSATKSSAGDLLTLLKELP